jgi:hypothetical protein
MDYSSSVLEGIDKTPEIYYEDGLSNLVVTYFIVHSDTAHREQVEYRLTAEGKYTQWQENLPNAYPNGPREIDLARFTSIAFYTASPSELFLLAVTHYKPGSLPIISLLGKTQDANRKLLQELGIEARHKTIEDYMPPQEP